MGFTPIAGPEFIYELTLGALLRPGARGVPTWFSDRPGESLAVKCPIHFQAIFREGEPLGEQHGRALAQWAQSPTTSPRPAPRKTSDRPRRIRSLASAHDDARKSSELSPELPSGRLPDLLPGLPNGALRAIDDVEGAAT